MLNSACAKSAASISSPWGKATLTEVEHTAPLGQTVSFSPVCTQHKHICSRVWRPNSGSDSRLVESDYRVGGQLGPQMLTRVLRQVCPCSAGMRPDRSVRRRSAALLQPLQGVHKEAAWHPVDRCYQLARPHKQGRPCVHWRALTAASTGSSTDGLQPALHAACQQPCGSCCLNDEHMAAVWSRGQRIFT